MESMADQYGFDDSLFMSETPGYLKCVVCQLVLRNPIQILTCGHKLCEVCFERMKNYSKNSEFRCPVDRDLIDVAKVCEDIGMKRVIGNLQVKCTCNEKGCPWNGDLRDLKVHEEKCEYKSCKLSSMQGHDEMMMLMRQLYERVGKCEETLADKEKENAYIKFNLQQTKDKFNGKLDLLNKKNENIEHKLELLKNELQGFKHIEGNMDKLTMKNEMLEQKVETLENELQVCKNQLQGIMIDVTTMKKEKVEVNREEKTLHAIEAAVEGRLIRRQETAKEIVIIRHRGAPADVIISNNHQVEFKRYSTVSIPMAVVPRGKKGWYEVTFEKVPGFSWIGWASSKFTRSDKNEGVGVGACLNSYAFNVQGSSKRHKEVSSRWGKRFDNNGNEVLDGNGNKVLGVAADMVNGKLLFGLNGEWSEPMGIAFDDIDTDIRLFPAFSAGFSKLEVNFGDRDFIYGPPDTSFEKLMDVV